MRFRLAGALVLVVLFTVALPALWAQRSNSAAYDQSRNPTPNQLLAACPDEWSILSKNGNVDDSAWSFIYKITQASSAELLSSSYVDGQSSAYCANFGRCDAAIRRSVQCFVDQTLAGRAGRFRTPSMTVKTIVDGNSTGRQDPQGYAASPARTAPTASPTVSAKAAPTVAANLPKARPARTAPWSPRAMSTDASEKLDPRYAAERADILASCSVPASRYAALRKEPQSAINLMLEGAMLDDETMASSPDRFRTRIQRAQAQLEAENDERKRAVGVVLKCALERRLAQLEGSPLVPGAADGSLTPLSIGGSVSHWKQQGKDAHIIAGNGKSAMHCVSLETIASGDSNLSGAVARRVLVNHCADEVGFIWCNSPGDCDTERGSAWNLLPGRSWPIAGDGEVRWAACHGRDTASTVRGSYGLRYYCSAPMVKSKG